MKTYDKFYIDGAWVDPAPPHRFEEVINPATEEAFAKVALGNKADVDRAVAAAKAAFPGYSQTTKEYRLDLFGKIIKAYQARYADIMNAITEEMGAPLWLSKAAQAATGVAHFNTVMGVLKEFEFTKNRGGTQISYEPVGVCGFITPWNWPINQIVCKVAPALAAGCTMVLKPSEIAPVNAILLAEVLHEAGVPKGVFNLVNGDGPGVGQFLSAHPDIDMMSFTGSTRGGIAVAKTAADTVKRVHQELGGKSANIILPDADLAKAVANGVQVMMSNSGQSCNAPSRMFVQRGQQAQAIEIAKAAAEKVKVGDPKQDGVTIGPVVSKLQYDKIQALIEKGIKEGATLVTGGLGRPEGLNRGYYVRPTVFANVTNDMTIAREEIFGPVLSILPYDTVEQAVAQANDTVYGLSGYVYGGTLDGAKAVGRQLRTGNVHLNGAGPDFGAPFGGFKQSGNGREWGEYGFLDFLEVKAMLGHNAA
ncbi:MAG TPA: aldehyde dehydrogenase family protein [Alphaproteobacteria bacterium]|nr:aldehyde dehydrogenase family protein [Alphaproteobacteria bacterium]